MEEEAGSLSNAISLSRFRQTPIILRQSGVTVADGLALLSLAAFGLQSCFAVTRLIVVCWRQQLQTQPPVV